MAKKTALPTKAGTKYQMLRLPVDLLEELDKAGKANSRTVPKEAEFRLRESLSRTGPVPAMSPWTRAVTDTLTRLVTEIDEIGTGPEVRYGMLETGLSVLFMKLRPADTRLSKDDEDMVQTLVTYLAQKVRRERGGLLEGTED